MHTGVRTPAANDQASITPHRSGLMKRLEKQMLRPFSCSSWMTWSAYVSSPLIQQLKAELSEQEAVKSETVAYAYVENFALRIFLGADNEDRQGHATRYAFHVLTLAGPQRKPLSRPPSFWRCSEPLVPWTTTYKPRSSMQNGKRHRFTRHYVPASSLHLVR